MFPCLGKEIAKHYQKYIPVEDMTALGEAAPGEDDDGAPRQASIWPAVGRTSTYGSMSPVGRMIISTTCDDCLVSQSPGVAETKMVCGISRSNS